MHQKLQQTKMVQWFRSEWRKAIRGLLLVTAHRWSDDILRQPAIIFSPHFDDESLGCGGTIIRKIRSGARINIVFMTDGSKSHSRFIPEKKLMKIRSKEALAAAKKLGLQTKQVTYLGYEETKLGNATHHAVERIKELLEEERPDEIFLPYYFRQAPKDHSDTNRIAILAARKLQLQVTINEYPVWYWNQWPFVPFSGKGRSSILRHVAYTLLSNLGVLKDFRDCVYIKDILPEKKQAIDEYKSQMTRLNGDTSWVTLSDVSNGEFIKCFFQDYEYFHRYHIKDARI